MLLQLWSQQERSTIRNDLSKETVIHHSGTCPTEHEISHIPGVGGETVKYDLLHVIEEGVAENNVAANICFDLLVRTGTLEGNPS